MGRTGHVIVLNGPSSAGKTTLAAAVRTRLGPTAAVVAIDQMFPCMHPDAAPSWPQFAALTDAMFRSAAALADHGYDVIADTVFERAECLEIMRRALADRAYHLIGVTAPVDVLDARERQRGDRHLGQARAQHERGVWHAAHYELQVDTHALAIDDCVDRVVALWPAR